MKKKIVFSLTMVLALAMMSLTAFAAAPSASVEPDKAEAKTGDTVTYTVVLDKVEGSLEATVETANLEITDVDADFYADGKLVLAYYGQSKAASATFTCKVTGEAGQEASLKLTNVATGEGTNPPAAAADIAGASVKIAGAVVKPTDPADPTNPAEPTDPAEPTNPAEPTKPADPTKPAEPTKPADPTKPVSNGNLDKAPNTGDTTASVWPLVLIGCMGVAAAVVAGKKLAYRK